MTVENILPHGLKTSVVDTDYETEDKENLALLDKNRIETGLFSERPSAGNPERFFYATDTGELFYDDGSVWLGVADVIAAHSSSHAAGGADALTHQNLSGAGGNSHATIDSHLADGAKHFLMLDENNMASDSSATVPSQQSVKAYVDNGYGKKGNDVASASTLTLGTDGSYFKVTGTTGITSINTKRPGTRVLLEFASVITITHHDTNLILPGGTGRNIVTVPGMVLEFFEYDTGKWICTSVKQPAHAVKAHRNGVNSSGLASGSTIPLDTADWNDHGRFNTGTYKYTCSGGGLFHVESAITFTGAETGGKNLDLRIYQNGTSVYRSRHYQTATYEFQVYVSGLIRAASGDEIYVAVGHDYASNPVVYGLTTFSWMTVRRVDV